MEKKIKYNAFISYNHNPRDIAIAKNLQTKLERFRVPKGLKTAKGVDDIERVFLDVGELGVAADLNDTIKDALDNTDYLIVIASPESKASQWCHKEVEHFLTTHTADQILTVLTDGEPIDVLPEEVMHQKIVAEDGTVTYVDREPLSCDYRNGIKEGNKRELERLVAGIIGCRYDDLVQRQRQYKLRRMTIAFTTITAVMLVALSYFIWSNRTISKNYNNTLREQSRSMALQSERAMSGGDKVGAIKYALEALPKEGDERPVVAEAVRALSKATEIYHAQTDGIEARRELIADESLYNIDLASEGERHILAATTYNGEAFIFDANSGEKLAENCLEEICGSEGGKSLCLLPGESKAVVVQSKAVTALDYNAEKELWSLTFDKDEYISTAAAVCGKKNIVVQKTKYKDSSEKEETALCIDMDDGTVIFDTALPMKDGKNPIIRSIEISPNEETAMLRGEYYINEESQPCLVIFDLITGATRGIDTEGIGEIDDAAYTEDGRLIVCGIKEKRDEELTQTEDRLYQMGDTSRHQSITGKKTVVLRCIEQISDTALWAAEYEETFSGKSEVSRKDGFSPVNPIIINGSKLRELGASGEETARMETQSRIKFAKRTADGEGITAVLEDGGGAFYQNGDEHVRIISNYFHDSIVLCESVEGSYYLVCYDQDGGGKFRILKYVAGVVGDKRWEAYESRGQTGLYYTEDVAAYEDSFIESYKDGNRRFVERIKAETGESFWKTELNDGSVLNNLEALIDEAHGRLIVSSSDEINYETKSGKLSFQTVNLSDGSLESVEVDTDGSVSFADLAGVTADGRIVVCYNNYEAESACVGIADTDKNAFTFVNLGDAKELSHSTELCYDRNADVLIVTDESSLAAYKAEGNRLFELRDLPYTLKAAAAGFDGNIYVIGEAARAADEGGKLKLYCYDGKSGAETDKGLPLAGISLKGNFLDTFGSLEIKDISEGEYLLRLDETGMIADKESGLVRSELPDMKAYNDDEKQFFIDGGHAPYRTLTEMIEEAKELLN
ncbi:MAG: toll/interleukin-1 receptor domain-containing protein [Mogibacterium sp.]|nr:toll/interleukin-1 receptor domain-containing protein [Mogibacterium sp.]